MPNLSFDREVSQTEIHRQTGAILREFYRDGGTVAVRDRWGEICAVVLIGPKVAELEKIPD